MSDTPKFEVIDRRKYRLEDEPSEAPQPAAGAAPTEEKPVEFSGGPRLVTPQPELVAQRAASAPNAGDLVAEDLVADDLAGDDLAASAAGYPAMPPPPTPEESREQKLAYDASSRRLEDIVRAQNPGAGAQPPVTFEHLVQQLYLSAMIQMGAGAQEGQRPRVDILGARQTIDLLAILAEKSQGNLNTAEQRMIDTVLFEARMAFLELTNMISMPGVPAPPPGKR